MGLTKVAAKHAASASQSALVPVVSPRAPVCPPDRFSEMRSPIARPMAPRPATKPPWVLAHTTITSGSTQSIARRSRRKRNRIATNTAKKANVNSCGRKRKKREIVDAQSTNTGTQMWGLRLVFRMAAATK